MSTTAIGVGAISLGAQPDGDQSSGNVGAVSLGDIDGQVEIQCVGHLKNVTVEDWYKQCHGGAVHYETKPSKQPLFLKSTYIRVVAIEGHAVLIGVDHFSNGKTGIYSIGLLPLRGKSYEKILNNVSTVLMAGHNTVKGMVGSQSNPFKDKMAGAPSRKNKKKLQQKIWRNISFASPAYEINSSQRENLIDFVETVATEFHDKKKFFSLGNFRGFNCLGFVKHVLKRDFFQGQFRIEESSIDYAVAKKLTLVSTVGVGIDNLSPLFKRTKADMLDSLSLEEVEMPADVAKKFKEWQAATKAKQLEVDKILKSNVTVNDIDHIADRLTKVLEVDSMCDSPAARALVSEYVKNFPKGDLEGTLNSVPFFQIYKLFHSYHTEQQNPNDFVNALKMLGSQMSDKTLFVRNADLDMFPELNRKQVDEQVNNMLKTMDVAQGFNPEELANVRTEFQQGYIFFDFKKQNPFTLGIPQGAEMEWYEVKNMNWTKHFSSPRFDSSFVQQLQRDSAGNPGALITTPSSFLQPAVATVVLGGFVLLSAYFLIAFSLAKACGAKTDTACAIACCYCWCRGNNDDDNECDCENCCDENCCD